MKEDIYYRILLVENQKGEFDELKSAIAANFPVSIDVALSSNEAMVLIDYHTYDLTLIKVSGGNGFKLIEYIQESFLNSSSAIIAVSENKRILKEITGKDRKINFIVWPVAPENFIEMMDLHFRLIKKEMEFNVLRQAEIKQRLSVELELARSQENFKNIVNKSNAAILIVDHEGTIQFVNEASEQIFLRQKENLIGHQFGTLLGNDERSEIDIVRYNGEIGVGEVTTADTEWKGKPAKLILINDITKHKLLQENLEVAIKKAQESDRLKTAFLANMSHEIRTPLNGILGFSQLMDENNLDKERRQFYIKSIISCGNYLLDIINDIIDIAQIEANQLIISKSNFDPIKLINEIYELYKINTKLMSKGLELSVEYPRVQSVFVHSDPSRVKQIIFNLLNNAIKFTDKGKISFGFELKNNNLQFFVKDSGRGIPKSDFETIFNRFQQLEAPKNKLNEGNGLGLSISRALVHLLDGTIWLESEETIGTTFYFTIPSFVTKDGPIPVESFTKVSKVKAGFRNKKILIVEDEENNFYFIQAVITSPDTIIYWAKNGEEAVDIAMKEDIDLILMDMKLPLKSGYEAVKEIRLQKPKIPIIAQTAYAMSNDKDKVMAVGCNDYIAKPINVNELMNKMNSLLN